MNEFIFKDKQKKKKRRYVSLFFIYSLPWSHPGLNAIWIQVTSTFISVVISPEIHTHIYSCKLYTSSLKLISRLTYLKLLIPFSPMSMFHPSKWSDSFVRRCHSLLRVLHWLFIMKHPQRKDWWGRMTPSSTNLYVSSGFSMYQIMVMPLSSFEWQLFHQ